MTGPWFLYLDESGDLGFNPDKPDPTTQKSAAGAIERIEELIPLLEGVKDARQVAD